MFCVFAAMRALPLLLLLFCIGCQSEWMQESGSRTIPGGELVEVTYSTPQDSGRYAIVLRPYEPEYRFAGYTVRHAFPPEPTFEITVRYDSAAVADSFVVVYDGAEGAATALTEARDIPLGSDPLLVVGVSSSGQKYMTFSDVGRTRLGDLPLEMEEELRRSLPHVFSQE